MNKDEFSKNIAGAIDGAWKIFNNLTCIACHPVVAEGIPCEKIPKGATGNILALIDQLKKYEADTLAAQASE